MYSVFLLVLVTCQKNTKRFTQAASNPIICTDRNFSVFVFWRTAPDPFWSNYYAEQRLRCIFKDLKILNNLKNVLIHMTYHTPNLLLQTFQINARLVLKTSINIKDGTVKWSQKWWSEVPEGGNFGPLCALDQWSFIIEWGRHFLLLSRELKCWKYD